MRLVIISLFVLPLQVLATQLIKEGPAQHTKVLHRSLTFTTACEVSEKQYCGYDAPADQKVECTHICDCSKSEAEIAAVLSSQYGAIRDISYAYGPKLYLGHIERSLAECAQNQEQQVEAVYSIEE